MKELGKISLSIRATEEKPEQTVEAAVKKPRKRQAALLSIQLI